MRAPDSIAHSEMAEDLFWGWLTCFFPFLPRNIVELGMVYNWVYRITELPNILLLQSPEELWKQRACLRAPVECSSQMQHPMTDVEVRFCIASANVAELQGSFDGLTPYVRNRSLDSLRIRQGNNSATLYISTLLIFTYKLGQRYWMWCGSKICVFAAGPI